MSNNINIFESATRLKLRFQSDRGLLSVEDLWDVSLDQIDRIAISLNKKIKETEEVSFLSQKRTDETLVLQFEITKRIIEVRLAEIEKTKQESIAAQKRQQLLDVLSRKENQELESLSIEEIRERIQSL